MNPRWNYYTKHCTASFIWILVKRYSYPFSFCFFKKFYYFIFLIPVIFSTYFLSQHHCFHCFFLRRSADPPGSPPSILPTAPLFFRQLCSVPHPAILTVALVSLYLQLPSPRPLSGRYAASESLPFERSFRLLYCFANGLPLPVDSDCIQCLMYEKLSCFR